MARKSRQVRRAARVMPGVLAALLIGVLISNGLRLRIAVTNPPWSIVAFMSLLFVVLTVLSVVGLLRIREWGFYSVYLLVPFSTVFHEIALVPFVTNALPSLQLRIWAVGVLNALFFLVAAVTHWTIRSDRAAPAVGGTQPT